MHRDFGTYFIWANAVNKCPCTTDPYVLLYRFVWIMGTAMVYSFQSLMRNATPKKWIFWKIFKRSCILFVLGLLINCDGLAGRFGLFVFLLIVQSQPEMVFVRFFF